MDRKVMNESSPVFAALVGVVNLGEWVLKCGRLKSLAIANLIQSSKQFIFRGLRSIMSKVFQHKTSYMWQNMFFIETAGRNQRLRLSSNLD